MYFTNNNFMLQCGNVFEQWVPIKSGTYAAK